MPNALNALGRNEEAVAVVVDALAICARTSEGWLLPELMRVRAGHNESAQGAIAREEYRSALALAASQGALAWELRIANSLVKLEDQFGKVDDGRAILTDVVATCAEGRLRRDYLEAKRLLDG